MNVSRPTIITILCVLGFIGTLVNFPGVFSHYVRKLGDLFPAIFGLILALKFISLIGIWYMKRWGVLLYIGSFTVGLIIELLVNSWGGIVDIISVGFSCILIIVGSVHYSRMEATL